MQSGSGTSSWRGRGKTCAKIGLIYFASLSLTVLIFTAINQENVNSTQARWWWALLISLFLTLSTTLVTLYMTWSLERYRILDPIEAFLTKKSPSQHGGEMAPVSPPADDDPSASFKTVLTINSGLPNGFEGAEKTQSPASVTVIDMRKNNPPTALKTADNQAFWMHADKKSGKSKTKKKRK